MEIITTAALAGLAFWGGWAAHSAVQVRRARRVVRALREAAESIASRAGVEMWEQVDPDQIKAGDRIVWHNGDHHIHYEAGYDGDRGQQTGGQWARPRKEG